MESQKIYLAGDQGNSLNSALVAALQNRGVDPSVLAMLNNGNGFFGNGNDLLGLIILFAVFGGGFGWGGYGNGRGGSSTEREMIMSAIQRNGIDINTLASTLNCSVGQIQSGINALGTQLCNLSAQTGQSAMQIVNAIQAGNQTLSAQLAQCCCDNKLLITEQGYQNQLAIANQTSALGGKIDAQTALINDKFCAQEMREMQNKIDALREENSTYKTSAMTSQIVGSAVAPINAAVAGIQSEIAGIKCALPPTTPVPTNRGIYLDQCVAAQLGFYGGFPYGGGIYQSGSIWS